MNFAYVEELMISQPAISKQLRTFQQATKCKLLDRHPRGLNLTSQEVIVASYAARVFALLKETETAVSDLTSLKRGSLSIGAGPTVGVYLPPRAMVQFCFGHPMVHLHAETENTDVLRQQLLDGAIEVVVSESPMLGAELSSKVLMTDVLVPVVSKTHPLTKRKPVIANEFCKEPFIARQVNSGAGSHVERILRSRGLNLKPIVTVGSTEAIKQAVIAGLGVAMISRLEIQTEIAAQPFDRAEGKRHVNPASYLSGLGARPT